MTHPIDKYNQQQADTLATLPADQREYMARMFRIGNAAYRYHHRLASEPTEEDFTEFLEGLPQDNIRNTYQAEGFNKAVTSWPFRRYIQEKNDIGMGEFMRQHLSADDYVFYVETSKP